MIGRKINNYEIRSLLGEGGMGSVYVAEHPVLNRRVAVKVLRRELSEDQSLVTRFMNEARAASAIRQPNIIEIFDVGVLPDGIPYLMMELLEGQSLAGRLFQEGRLSVDDALAIAGQAASALAAAHAKQIVHRDLKPDNLFLVPDENAPRGQRVVVLDFGIAKLRGDLASGSVKTHTGSVMGTPPYMSPEQCRGITDEIDHRTDIYALGIILHEMLVGATPFTSVGFGDLLVMHLTQPPPPLRSLDPTIPAHIEAVVLRALAKARDDRFASMAELKSALVPTIAPRVPTVQLPSPETGRIEPPLRAEASRPPVPLTIVAPRTTSTLSSTVGERVDAQSNGSRSRTMDRTLPARGSRRAVAGLAVGVAVAGVAAAILLFVARPTTQQAGPPPAAPTGAAAALAPSFKPAPPAAPLRPAPPATPPAPEPARAQDQPRVNAAPADNAAAMPEAAPSDEPKRKSEADRPAVARSAKHATETRPPRTKARGATGEGGRGTATAAQVPPSAAGAPVAPGAPASTSPPPSAAPAAPAKPHVSADKW